MGGTTDSGSTGLNLQVANIVINMDLPWNPAKLEQRIARAWRKNQTKTVQVINFVTSNTIEHRMLGTLAHKQNLANGVLDGIGDFSSMGITSARAQILEQLEEMFISEEEAPEDAPKEPEKKKDLQDIAEEAVKKYNDRIHLIEKYENKESGEKTILTIVDTLDHDIAPRMEEMLSHQNEGNSPVQTEVLDSATYELLQRLSKAGIITINEGSSQTFHRSVASQKQHQTEKEKRLKEAQKHFANTERKHKMSKLLSSGGFVIEALPAAEEAVSFGLKSYFALKMEHHNEGQLLQNRLQNCSEDISEGEAVGLLSAVDNFMEICAVAITKYAMN